MQFNSIEFIVYFLPPFLAAYHLVPERFRRWVMLAGSAVFYGISTGWGALPMGLLAITAAAGYLGGLALARRREGWVLASFVAPIAGSLIFFKLYRGGALLPVGMSFYVFQLTAYLADVYRGRLPAERDGSVFAAAVVMFPKLLSGPIGESPRLIEDARRPRRSSAAFHLGLQEFILGLGMEVILANRLGGVWAQGNVVGFEAVSTPYAWLAIVTYALRLYFDFYGYSMMALGLGHMMGYALPVNFLEPYSAKTVSEFYRRWHVTLGRWFRDYIYIPLGGSRRGTGRTILNLAAVWALTGFWHGVGGGYMLWAGFLLAFIVLERLWLGEHLRRSRWLAHVYLPLVILLSWVPFASGSVQVALTVYGRLFAVGGAGSAGDFLYWAPKYAFLVGAGVLCATPLPKLLWGRIRGKWYGDALLLVLFWVCLYFMATSAQDPFIYFNF